MRVMSLNCQRGGTHTSTAAPDTRFDALMAAVIKIDPDVLGLQELMRWHDNGERALAACEAATGLRAAGITPGRGINGTAVLYRPDMFTRRAWEHHYQGELLNGLGTAVLETGQGRRLNVASLHLASHSVQAATIEAQLAVTRIWRQGGRGILCGDINHFPWEDGGRAPGAVPDPDDLPPYNLSSRWHLSSDGALSPDRSVGAALTRGRLVDAAHLMWERTGDAAYLAATGRGRMRVDQVWLTPDLAPALTDYTARWVEGSDHASITADFDLDQADESLLLAEVV